MTLHNRFPGRRLKEVDLAYLEGERHPLPYAETIRGPDTSDDRLGVAGQVEIGFRTQGLDHFYHCFHSALRRSLG